MQTVTAEIAAVLLALTGVPAHLEGIFITTPTGYFQVAEACAGRPLPDRHARLRRAGRQRLLPLLAAPARLPGRRDPRPDPRQRRPRLGHDLRRRSGPAASISPRASIMSSMAASSSPSSSRLILGARLALLRPRRRTIPGSIRRALPDERRPRRSPTSSAPLSLWRSRRCSGRARSPPPAPRRSRPRSPCRTCRAGSESPAGARLAAPFRRRRPDRPWPAIATAQGRTVDLAIAVFASQSEGRELVGFGQGAVAPDGRWAWTADAPPPPDGRAERIASHGVERAGGQLLPCRRCRDGERGEGEARNDEGAPARRPAARGRGARLRQAAAGIARPAIDDFLRALGPIAPLADRAAGLGLSRCAASPASSIPTCRSRSIRRGSRR